MAISNILPSEHCPWRAKQWNDILSKGRRKVRE